jgi:hypothetical protein
MSLTSLVRSQEKPINSSGKRNTARVAAAFRNRPFRFAAIRSACCALSLALVGAARCCATAAAQDHSADELHKFNESVTR